MTSDQDRWIVCADYSGGPYTQARAESELASFARAAAKDERLCQLPHEIVASPTRPDRKTAGRP